MSRTNTCAHLRRSAAAAVAVGLLTSTAHAQDFRLDFPPILTMSPKGVNIQTGRFELSQKEFAIGPLTVDLRWTSMVNNQTYAFPTSTTGMKNIDIGNPANGIARNLRGWLKWDTVTGYNGVQITVINVQIGDTFLQYSQGAQFPNNYTARNIAAQAWNFQVSGNDIILTNQSGDVYTFVNHAAIPAQPGWTQRNKVLSSVVQADGHRLDYSYGTVAELKSVTSNRGYVMILEYASSTSTITACGYNTAVTYVSSSTTCASAPVKTSYGFSSTSGSLRLTSITDVDANISTVSYTGNYISCVTLPASATCRVQNFYGPQSGEVGTLTAPDQVRKQITATNDTWLYSYHNPPGDWDDMPPLPPGEIRTTYGRMRDPLDRLTVATYANGVVTKVEGPEGELDYTFDGLCPETITFPEGNVLQFGSNDGCLVGSKTSIAKPGSGLASTTMSVSFPPHLGPGNPVLCSAASAKLCDKPIKRTDERGNITDFTHDAAHGGMLTETAPAVNSVRAQTRYTYAQRYAWIKNSSGSYVQAATPVWVPTQKSLCKTGAASGAGCAVGGDEVRTLYDYGPNSGPNNLVLRGTVEDATGEALRTCYAYDAHGNKISETRPRAGLSSCP